VYVCALGRSTGPQQERGVYRTTDAGKTWTRVLFVDEHTGCSGLNIDRAHPNVLFAGMWQVVMHTYAMTSGGPSSAIHQTTDGGLSFPEVPWGGDTHDIWWDPKNADRFAITTDANTRFTSDHGKTWLQVTLPIAQMYHVAVDKQAPYWVYGNRQDNGTMRGP